ncbi:NAD(P)/FAD-dependent oxidoreductase [uncultured Caulobacter sp.]|uniref:NAD(P)/FAD-dependent oxidoreductase n=1 Tax=uncultured Caulobacter sp. TaxID=158749 RepID=UPI0026069A6C|nr:NAD(P)/FAD-dependent oxidoreductase [uncultured Caulobacter sp.]
MERYEAIIVGAGPAGLTAATYLGRFRRRVLILDGGRSRAAWIPRSHNTPGFASGVGGPELLRNMGEQACRYGAERRAGLAETLSRTEDGFALRVVDAGGRAAELSAPFVLLATGVIDRLPALQNLEAAIAAARVRMCPICDAYEAIDQKIAVLGDDDLGAREAAFLTTYSKDVTLLHLGQPSALRDPAALAERGIEVLPVSIGQLAVDVDGVSVALADGETRAFDCLYLALGCEMRSRLAVRWGAEHDPAGNLIVDAHQRTSIDGLYAAGDVVRGLNQIAVAAAEAAIAATDIHNRLRALDDAEKPRAQTSAPSPGLAMTRFG